MSFINRETVRDAVATGLDTALVQGGTQYAHAVYNYQHFSWQGLSPIVLVYSTGAERPVATFAGGESVIYLMVSVWVTTVADGSYTEADAEDQLDLVEKQIADWVQDNRATANWRYIEHDGRSEVMEADVGGHPYLMELIPLRVLVLG